MNKLDLIVSGAGVLTTLIAAYWWLRASLVEVPDNINTFIGELQKASRLNAYGAMAAVGAAVGAALCAAYGFARQASWL